MRWVLTCAAVRAHVSHSTLLVSCRLSFLPFPPLVTPVSGRGYSPPQRRRESRATRKFGLDIVGSGGGGKRVITSQNMACFSAVHPKTVCASLEQETCLQLTSQ